MLHKLPLMHWLLFLTSIASNAVHPSWDGSLNQPCVCLLLAMA